MDGWMATPEHFTGPRSASAMPECAFLKETFLPLAQASLKQLMDSFDSLERTLQVIPLCACTTIIRGGTYPVPFCRACKPHVLRWTDYSSALGVSGTSLSPAFTPGRRCAPVRV